MSGSFADATGDGAAYSFRPSLLGAPSAFKLTGDGVDWAAGNKSGHIPYRAIRRLRMSYRPANMQSHRFVTEIWAEDAPKLQIVSTSWKSMMHQERLDRPYAAFVAELHRRVAANGVPVRCEQGHSQLKYWPAVIVAAAVMLGLCLLIVRALEAGAPLAAAFIALFLALFLWQGGDFLRRNRPGLYRAEAPPPDVMPKA